MVVHAHAFVPSIRLARGSAEQALGPHQQEQDEDEQRGGVLEVAGDHRAASSSTTRPMTSEPTRAPKAVPRPPSVTAANSSSRICSPVSHLMPLIDQGVQDAGEAGQGHRDRPDQPDHLVDVDARGLRPAPGCRRPRGSPVRCGCAAARSRPPRAPRSRSPSPTSDWLVIVTGPNSRTVGVVHDDADGARRRRRTGRSTAGPARGRSSRSSAGSAPARAVAAAATGPGPGASR